MAQPTAPELTHRLVCALQNPALYPHSAEDIALLETHISSVLLVGGYAYKLKKPYNLEFLDFTTLEARHRACAEEIRLNRRLAPELYLEVVPITGTHDAPRIGGNGPTIEYAVKMRRFPQGDLLSTVLTRGALRVEQLDRLAHRIAAFHASLPGAGASQPFGEPSLLDAAARQNFDQIAPLLDDASERARLQALRVATTTLFTQLLPTFLRRKQQGFIRECHGDLHLGNMALIDGEIVPFDCLEFNAAFRWNDVMSEVAFVIMDLASRGHQDLGFRFLNSYLERTGDFDGLRVLRYYLMFRAVVRAKVAAMLASEAETPDPQRARARQDVRHYLDLADGFAQQRTNMQVLMHGMSGSGKTSVARALAMVLPAIHVRSDVERKRLFGLDPLAQSASGLGTGIYSSEATARTYARLADIAREALRDDYTIIVDAAFLDAQQRAPFYALGDTHIISCEAPESVLRQRILARLQTGSDAAEATLGVLEKQCAGPHELLPEEMGMALVVDTQQPVDALTLASRLLPNAANE